jgi:hypothetical protein
MDKIKEKIEKLLRLAESSNEHEAQSALARANELMLRHNITDMDFTADKEYVRFVVGEPYFREGPELKYVNTIIHKFFFVKVVKVGTGGKKWGERDARERVLEFWGTPENVASAVHVHRFLREVFKTLWADHKKATGKDDTHRQSFYTGLQKGLWGRLEKSQKTFEDEHGLVVIPDPGLQKMLEDEDVVTRSAPRPNYDHFNSTIAEGEKESAKISLSGGIEFDGKKAATAKKLEYTEK